MSEVLVDIHESVATVTLDRPEVKNAINWAMVDALTDAGRKLARDPDVRAVVITGADGVFCSGIDVTTFAGEGGEFEPIFAQVARFQAAFDVFEELGCPVIAAVEKYCYGAGFQLAIACDLRVIADGAQLSVMETKWGIIPDLGATTRLPRLIGLSRAKDLAMTARIIDADEADQLGLADRRTPEGGALKTATELARELAAGPPLAIGGIKRLMNSSFDSTVRQGLEREQAVQRRVLASRDFTEAVAARFEKRKPRYEGK